MALRDHRIGSDRGRAVSKLELMTRVAAATTTPGADRETRGSSGRTVDDHSDLAETGVDRGGGVRSMGDEGRAAHIGAVHIVGREIQVVAEADDTHHAHPDAGGKNAINILDCQTTVVECAPDTLRHDLVHAL